MKVSVRSSVNGLIQEVDVTTAGCGGLCPDTQTPPDPFVFFLLENGVYNGAAGRIESVSQLGSYYGSGPTVENLLVLGYVLFSPVSTCSIEPPGQDTATVQLILNGQLVGTVSVQFDPVTGFYFLLSAGDLPQITAYMTFGTGTCIPAPEECEGGLLMVNNGYEGNGTFINSSAQSGSAYGAEAPINTQFVMGFFSTSPMPECAIEPPGTSTLSMGLVFDGVPFITADVAFEATQNRYYIVVPDGTTFPAADGCLTFTFPPGSCAAA